MMFLNIFEFDFCYEKAIEENSIGENVAKVLPLFRILKILKNIVE